jgi:hypothetical protein
MQRMVLKTLTRALREWKGFVVDGGVLVAAEHRAIKAHQLLALRYVCLLLGHKGQYALATAFEGWKRAASVRGLAGAFVSWSLQDAPRLALCRHFLHALYAAAKREVDPCDSVPFRLDIPVHRSTEPAPSVISYQQTAVSIVVGAMMSLRPADAVGTDWVHRASKDEVRTLFYRLIIARVYRNKIQRERARRFQFKQSNLDRFQAQYTIATYPQIKAVRDVQRAEDSEMARFRRQVMTRDEILLASLAIGDSVDRMKKHAAKFSPQPTRPPVLDPAFAPQPPARRAIVVPKDVPIPHAPPHPVLDEVSIVKSRALSISRRNRRAPDQVFAQGIGRTKSVSDLSPGSIPLVTSVAFIAHGYDPHQSVLERRDFAHKVSNRGFHLSELQTLKSRADRILGKDDLIFLAAARRKSLTPRISLSAITQRVPFESAASFSLTKIAPGYCDNATFSARPKEERVALLYSRFFAFLNFVLYGSTGYSKPVDFRDLHERIFCITRRMENSSQPFIPFTEPTINPDHDTLLIGLVLAKRITQPVEFKCFGVDQLKAQIDSFLRPAEDLPVLLTELQPRMAIEEPANHVERSLKEIIDSIASRAIAVEAAKKQPEPKRPSQVTVVQFTPDAAQDFAAGRQQRYQRTVRNRLAFAEDVITTIFKGSIFITSSMSFDPVTHVDPFVGIGELHAVIMERVQEPPIVIPEKIKGKKADKKTAKKKRGAKQSTPKEVDPHEINFFLFMAPYIIPCEILTRMIREEQQNAVRKH